MEAGAPLKLSITSVVLIASNDDYELYDVEIDKGLEMHEVLKMKIVHAVVGRSYTDEAFFYQCSISWKHDNIIKGEYFRLNEFGRGCFYYENFERLDSARDLSCRQLKLILLNYCAALDFIHSSGYYITQFHERDLVIRRRNENVEGCFVSISLQPKSSVPSLAARQIRENFHIMARTFAACIRGHSDASNLNLLVDFIKDFQTSDTLWAFPSLMSSSHRISHYARVGNAFKRLDHDFQTKIENEFMEKIHKPGQTFEWLENAKSFQCFYAALGYDNAHVGDTTSIRYQDGLKQFLRFCRNLPAHITRQESPLLDFEDQVDQALTGLCPEFLDVMHYILYKKYVFIVKKQPQYD
ncbi:hypothetical protein PIB30_030164 [Stylosanthes scabra]|uniref:Uncharacterized protein n=1 Tax=Stylosanthes scabra TaxID=79078 RepID=A0ABU6RBQ2_9FABA|nr:hypothetical protein [Stylosanthes scabra]